MNLRDTFRASLEGRASEPALDWRGESFSFGEIEARSNRMAQALRAGGLSKGDRLCVWLANSIDLVDIYLACVKLGVIVVPINILYRERERRRILDDAKPKVFLQDSDLPALRELTSRQYDDLEEVPLGADSPAALVYTSGTTGTPKGAILTHGNFAVNGQNLIGVWGITDADRLLLALPLFHVHALGNGLHTWLQAGCHMRLLERFEYEKAPGEFLDYRPTLFFGVPTIYVRLLETPPEIAADIGGEMRLFVSGSAPLPAHVLGEFESLFGHRILERYGMTETLMNISNPYDGERRAGSVGFPLPGVEARIVDAGGEDVDDGETGEIWLRGPNVFAGYWGREDATSAAFTDGWFRTGDMAARSEDGYYTLSGRQSDLIISGGFNVYPREIEEFLLEQPSVSEAAVVGEPHPTRGEVPVAYVVANGEIDTDALGELCTVSLATFKRPRRFEVVDQLPRNALGKVQKHRLKPSSGRVDLDPEAS